MTTARQKVLAYFMKTRVASAREAARALKMSAPTVRHHLRVLASDGRLEIVPGREQEGRGRPEKLYSLPQSALGDNLAALSDALITDAGSGLRPDRLARQLVGEVSFAGQPLARQLNLTVEKLNGMNYHARWEASYEGPRIIFTHCPYAAIIEKHPELCQMDQAMLREWMGQPAAQLFKRGKEGSSVCMFAVGKESR